MVTPSALAAASQSAAQSEAAEATSPDNAASPVPQQHVAPSAISSADGSLCGGVHFQPPNPASLEGSATASPAGRASEPQAAAAAPVESAAEAVVQDAAPAPLEALYRPLSSPISSSPAAAEADGDVMEIGKVLAEAVAAAAVKGAVGSADAGSADATASTPRSTGATLDAEARLAVARSAGTSARDQAECTIHCSHRSSAGGPDTVAASQSWDHGQDDMGKAAGLHPAGITTYTQVRQAGSEPAKHLAEQLHPCWSTHAEMWQLHNNSNKSAVQQHSCMCSRFIVYLLPHGLHPCTATVACTCVGQASTDARSCVLLVHLLSTCWTLLRAASAGCSSWTAVLAHRLLS